MHSGWEPMDAGCLLKMNSRLFETETMLRNRPAVENQDTTLRGEITAAEGGPDQMTESGSA